MKRSLFGIVLVSLLAMAACGDDAETESPGFTTASSSATATSTTTGGGGNGGNGAGGGGGEGPCSSFATENEELLNAPTDADVVKKN